MMRRGSSLRVYTGIIKSVESERELADGTVCVSGLHIGVDEIDGELRVPPGLAPHVRAAVAEHHQVTLWTAGGAIFGMKSGWNTYAAFQSAPVKMYAVAFLLTIFGLAVIPLTRRPSIAAGRIVAGQRAFTAFWRANPRAQLLPPQTTRP